MFYQNKIAVIIPSFRAADTITKVIKGIPEFVDSIIVVDDKSPDNLAEVVTKLNHPKVRLIRHEKNMGVGGAMKSGYKVSMEMGMDISVKMDSDDQMDPF